MAIGRLQWAISEGFIPSESLPDARRPLLSHEATCILNAGDTDAEVEIMLYFVNRDPVGPYRLTIAARRTFHQRFNELRDPEPVPLDTDYASIITSNVPIVVQHTRLDSRQAQFAIMTTMAFAGESSIVGADVLAVSRLMEPRSELGGVDDCLLRRIRLPT